MKEQIWNNIEEAVAQAIAKAIAEIAVELIETSVVIVVQKLKEYREEK